METAYLLADVGGTEIKCGICDENGQLVWRERFLADAKAGREEILSHFAAVFQSMTDRAGGCPIGGIGMAFPGPFDYSRGISLMRGLDKYDSIYGIPIGEALAERIDGIKASDFKFLHDVEAFAVGESRFGDCRKADRIFCLCIGTGAGSAFIRGGQAVKQGPDVSENGWIYSTPFKKTIIDDYISVRGLKKLSEKFLGKPLDGKALYDLCMAGDARAKKAYEVFGNDLFEAIAPFIESFKPQAIVFGGQISGSFEFFGRQTLKLCREKGNEIYLEKETSVRAMQGLFTVISGGDFNVKS